MTQPRRQQDIVGEAISYGLKKVIQENPRFKGFEGYLGEHLDSDAIKNKIEELALNSQDPRKIHDCLAEYVASGRAFDEKAKRLIVGYGGTGNEKGLFKSIQEKGIVYTLKQRRDSKNRGELEKIADTAAELSSLMSQEYAQSIPEAAQMIHKLDQYRFIGATIEMMKEKGLMDKNKYSTIQKAIYSGMKQGVIDLNKTLEDYVTFKKAAAILLGSVGLVFIGLNSSAITGGVIGTNQASGILFWIGIALTLLSGFVSFRLLKK